MAIADGTLDEKEVYDLGETAVACCRHLGITNIEEITNFMNEQLSNWHIELQSDRTSFVESNVQEFTQLAKQLAILSRSQRSQILRLCRTIAMADGMVQLEERALLEIAETHIGS